MKNVLYLAIMALVFSSCKKDSFNIPDVPPEPVLKANIFPEVTEPRSATLGDPNSIFTVGEQITIYVPYEVSHEHVTQAKLILTDETGEVVNAFDMTWSRDGMTDGLDVPQQLQGSNFLFVTIGLEELYAGKTLSIHTQVSGAYRVSDDHLPNAFSVQF
ncbi:MAG TPA: hypothetical protein VD993_08925 [Chitinophagaceae bacterium]|nr:hypothetical protein [Chitinophagaceae bacterium]